MIFNHPLSLEGQEARRRPSGGGCHPGGAGHPGGPEQEGVGAPACQGCSPEGIRGQGNCRLDSENQSF